MLCGLTACILQPVAYDRRFVLQPQPLALDYDEFEKLLLGLAVLQARLRKRADVCDEVLGELLDFVYKKAGVLLETTQASSA